MKSSFLPHFSEKVESVGEHGLTAAKVTASGSQRSGAKRLHTTRPESHQPASNFHGSQRDKNVCE
jgi:hypothetical protein